MVHVHHEISTDTGSYWVAIKIAIKAAAIKTSVLIFRNQNYQEVSS